MVEFWIKLIMFTKQLIWNAVQSAFCVLVHAHKLSIKLRLTFLLYYGLKFIVPRKRSVWQLRSRACRGLVKLQQVNVEFRPLIHKISAPCYRNKTFLWVLILPSSCSIYLTVSLSVCCYLSDRRWERQFLL